MARLASRRHLTELLNHFSQPNPCRFLISGSCAVVHAGVQSAAVNVICELARRNPKNYLSLAPLFFKLMTSSTNNWVLIKIIKLVSQWG